MKNYLSATLYFLTFLFSVQTAFAQRDYERSSEVAMPSTFSGSVGASLFNVPVGKIGSIKIDGSPTFQGAYDYQLLRWLSLGVAASYNKGTANAPEVTVTIRDQPLTGFVNATVSRTTISGRVLFHYVNNERLALYSGLRGGVSVWNIGVDTNIEGFGIGELKQLLNYLPTGAAKAVLPTVQLIGLGARVYVTPNIGVGAEVAVGSPYFIAGQVSVRF